MFAVRSGGRLIAATTRPDPTVGLVLYDLKRCLESLDEAAARAPGTPPAAARPLEAARARASPAGRARPREAPGGRQLCVSR